MEPLSKIIFLRLDFFRLILLNPSERMGNHISLLKGGTAMKQERETRYEASYKEQSGKQSKHARTLLDDLIIYLSGASGDMRG